MAVAFATLSASGAIGQVLTIEGCPYAFATADVSSVAFTADRPTAYGWCSTTVEWVILQGGLERHRGWSESIALVEPELDVSNESFRLHDVVAPSGDAAGSNVVTWLSRGQNVVAASTLNATISASVLSVVVDDGSVFGAANYNVWIDREALRVSSRAGNTLTIAASGRGILGSLAKIHAIDTDTSHKPIVWAQFPWLARRRVKLWLGTVSGGVLTNPIPMWSGIVSQSPRLESDGAMWELACDADWSTLGDLKLGVGGEACRLQGFTTEFGNAALRANLSVTASGTSTNVRGTPVTGTYATVNELAANVEQRLNANMLTAGTPGTARILPTGVSIRAAVTGITGMTSASLVLTSDWSVASMTGIALSPLTGVDAVIPEYPAGAQLVSRDYDSVLRMASVYMLPTAWYQRSDLSSILEVYWSRATLLSSGEDWAVEIDPDANLARSVEPVDQANRTVRGRVSVTPGNFSQPIPNVLAPAGEGKHWLFGALPFALHWRLSTNSWTYALQNAIAADTLFAGTTSEVDVNPSAFSWDRIDRLRDATPPQLRGRSWEFNGQTSLKDVIIEGCAFAGGMIAYKRGAIQLDAISKPLRSDVTDASHTITTADLVDDALPQWQENPEGIANVVDLTLDDQGRPWRWIVNDRRSLAAFGPRRRVEIKPHGIPITDEIRALGARYIAEHLYRRVIGLWGGITETITLRVSLSRLDSVWIGDTLTISDWLAPNVARTRGWSTRKAVLISREIDLERGQLTLKCLAFGQTQYSGFSPCVRLSDITTNVCTAAASYANGSDYAGSDQTGYADATRGTVANDRGTGFFKINDRVELVERDNTAPRAPESRYITAVDTAAKTITLDANPNAAWQAIIAGGGTVELRYDDYTTGSLQSTQKDYCWIGDRATRKISATDPIFLWVA